MEQLPFNSSLKRLCFSLFLIVLFTLPCHAEEMIGKIVGISDGDTATLLTPDKVQVKIRLYGIDAPEKDQPFGQKSKQMLSDLIFDKNVKVWKEDTDKYGRTVGRIYLNSTALTPKIDVNLSMISQGGAWAYRKYLGQGDQSFIHAEESAKKNKLGLWGLQEDQIMPPWDWRYASKANTLNKRNQTTDFPADSR